MNLRNILFTVSLLALVVTLGILSAAGMAWHYGDLENLRRLAWCAAGCFSLSATGGLFSWWGGRRPSRRSGYRDGFASVVLAWCVVIFMGALPFVVCGRLGLVDAVFETASGVSTTGATVLGGAEIESLPKCLSYWRCFLNWVGGIGFVMFILMVLPFLSGGKHLYNAEVPGLKSAGDQLTPRITSTSRILMLTYVVWTLLVILCYKLLGMGKFDAVCHAFTTVSTGGFSPHGDSLAYFGRGIQWASIFFMFTSACNFVLPVKLFVKRQCDYLKDEEFRTFFLCVAAASLLVAFFLHGQEGDLKMLNGAEPRTWESCLRTAAFHVVSIVSTTGYATSNFCAWGISCLPILLLVLMVVGGCAGSTAGGLKFARGLVLVKQTFGELRRKIAPHLLPDVSLNGSRLEMSIVHQTMAFLVLYLIAAGGCCFLLTLLEEMNLSTAMSATVSAISNVGPGFGGIAPDCNWGWMNSGSKLLLAFMMIAGRLELYTIFVVLLPHFWSMRRLR